MSKLSLDEAASLLLLESRALIEIPEEDLIEMRKFVSEEIKTFVYRENPLLKMLSKEGTKGDH